ncbi:hypothetical protein [Streptomyces sp. NPDC051567]|uniref:hypothetical protein n=1 Tax=Streptomyces sp. NPDC051567 TaxID=3365660 RepID=UPI0037B11C07
MIETHEVHKAGEVHAAYSRYGAYELYGAHRAYGAYGEPRGAVARRRRPGPGSLR